MNRICILLATLSYCAYICCASDDQEPTARLKNALIALCTNSKSDRSISAFTRKTGLKNTELHLGWSKLQTVY